jgi:hypothetical protein
MNIRLNIDLNFTAGVYYEGAMSMNNYMFNCGLVTNSYHPGDSQIAIERMRWWTANVLQSSIFLQTGDIEQQQKYWTAGLNLVILPEAPTDQIIAMMMFSKLNAICDGKLIVSDVQTTSGLSDGVRYIFDETDQYGVFTTEGWWNESDMVWFDKALLKEEKDGNIILNKGKLKWSDVDLHWDEEEDEKTGVVVDFKAKGSVESKDD